jgi:hypothetical protein
MQHNVLIYMSLRFQVDTCLHPHSVQPVFRTSPLRPTASRLPSAPKYLAAAASGQELKDSTRKGRQPKKAGTAARPHNTNTYARGTTTHTAVMRALPATAGRGAVACAAAPVPRRSLLLSTAAAGGLIYHSLRLYHAPLQQQLSRVA